MAVYPASGPFAGRSPDLVGVDDLALLRDLVPASLERRNIALDSLMRELKGNYTGLGAAGKMDEAAASRRSNLQGVSSALAARGLAGSGGERLARMGAGKGYAGALLDALRGGQDFETQRKQQLLNQFQALTGADTNFLNAMSQATINEYGSLTEESSRKLTDKLNWTNALGGGLNLAIAAAGAYYGGQNPNGLGGAAQGASLASSLAKAGQGGSGTYSAPSGQVSYGPGVAPNEQGTPMYPGQNVESPYGVKTFVPAGADAKYQRQLELSGQWY